MVKKKKKSQIGAWVFLFGVILATITGILISATWNPFNAKTYQAIFAVLLLLGILIGFLNVKAEEVNRFLIASLSLVIVSKFVGDTIFAIIPSIGSIISLLQLLFAPAIVIVALKVIFTISKN